MLNTHLGKAGGLNFGFEAAVYLLAEQYNWWVPSTTRPFFYGIVDARHACDERFWLQVLPAFFFSDARSQVTCVESISFVQLAHNYLGMKSDTDSLDMRNDFLFSGMAIIRNQSYGMTSCGTGGRAASPSASGTGSVPSPGWSMLMYIGTP